MILGSSRRGRAGDSANEESVALAELVGFVGGLDKRAGQLAGLAAGQFFTVDADCPADGAVAALDADYLDPDVIDVPDGAVEAARPISGAVLFEVVEESRDGW